MKAGDRTILHLDMDAFFAAVEELDHPRYRGKPVIVGADPKGGRGRGVVATANYEARKFGLHSAMPISQAYRRCPHGIYLRGRYDRYAEVSRQVMVILEDFSPTIEKISIDEAFADVTGSLKLFGGPEALGRSIKGRIREELQLTASIGIGPNKFLAKIASDLQKPDGFVIVHPAEARAFLEDLPITKLWGVGKKTEAILRDMGLRTIGQIARLPEETLQNRLGKWGQALWRLANGMDDRPVTPRSPQKSISQETTFEEDVDDEEVMERTLLWLCDELSRLMRKKRLKGRTVTLKIRLADFSTYTRSRTLPDFVDSTLTLKAVAVDLFRQFNRRQQKVRLLGVGVSQLNVNSGEQLGLFDQEASLDERLSRLLDSLRDKFGEQAVSRAALLER